MSVARITSAWRSDPHIGGNVVVWEKVPYRQPNYASLPEELHPLLAQALNRTGIQRLYSHQAAAWQHAAAGKNVVLVTGTASGKTLAYNLPVIDRMLRHPQARALYLFPTKALAQDQASALQKLTTAITHTPQDASFSPQLAQAIYDGDTPKKDRPSIRSKAHLVCSNPDMLHMGILPHHTRWVEFFRNLQFVVLDEMHIYRGVFGSHVANVIRRLKRIAAFYGAYPQFILTSATIANPAELAERLLEEEVVVVDDDGSARGAKHFLIYNPPIVDADLGLRRSALHESVRLADDLLAYGVQTILFGRSRRTVELILTYLRQKSSAQSGDLFGELGEPQSSNERVRGYRSGYLPRQRREIEQGLRQGNVRAVVATNALELGIDIGGMGAALMVGYPGTIAGTWQQSGRAGRGEEDSLAVLIATADPLDQFLAKHPEYLFGRSPEQALINPDNLLILLDHLKCAAFELPFRSGERFGKVSVDTVREFLEFLAMEGTLHASGEKYFWMAENYPAQNISLRNASVEKILLQVWDQDQPAILGEVDFASATWMVHPQAVYIHEGQPYLIEDLDIETHTARLRPAQEDYYTEPRRETTVELLEQNTEEDVPGGQKAWGDIQVTMQVTGFRKVRWYTHEQLGSGELSLPPTQLQTTGYWMALDDEVVDKLQEQGLWSIGPIDYGPNWQMQRRLARERDGYRCQICGAPESEREHDVHHKTPFRTFHSYEPANRLENLVTLCHPCHRRAETAVRIRSGLSGLSFALGHLAPFFLMCDVGDLGVHADPQSNLAEGRPAIVLYDHAPGGIGLSQRLYEMHDELVLRARDLVEACECTDGCPSCVGPGGEMGMGGKREALAILKALINTDLARA